eukprot:CAMPEP_0113319364 /NCGR_PEP_ID=MMETSP0010_2-20120614/13583_1 /TAXON_ID=216773 ORGANISM="Corethron hystrix, Strain 308" /NCGR_SAMPLE_ID=MMETSP0010_2 /ASSEMBLY_ACC=CAM_ASM_000155 /LENGTH=309 /DNA_ID=CAMNT_0000176893 /DNA_START=140 /DNA_END=1069 /DNA_ORIENTATION=- /assembly_acc=CAM_ASM_000155
MPWDKQPTPLTAYLLRRIQYFTNSFLPSRTSSLTNAATLRDVLDASIFFATSLGSRGSIGADFSPLLVPIFEDALVRIVTAPWIAGVAGLESTLQNARSSTTKGLVVPLPPDSSRESSEGTADADGSVRPPREMLAYPPLARVTNAILTGLNELRRCALPGTFCSLRSELKSTVTQTETVLKDHLRAVLRPGLRGDVKSMREIATELEEKFKQLFVPFWMEAVDLAMGLEKEKEDIVFEESDQDNGEVTDEMELKTDANIELAAKMMPENEATEVMSKNGATEVMSKNGATEMMPENEADETKEEESEI